MIITTAGTELITNRITLPVTAHELYCATCDYVRDHAAYCAHERLAAAQRSHNLG